MSILHIFTFFLHGLLFFFFILNTAFVDKFRYNAKKASMAQSRIKALKRMELLTDVVTDPTFRFEFPGRSSTATFL